MRLRRVAGLALFGVVALVLLVAGGVGLAPYLLSQFVAFVTAAASGFARLVQAFEEGRNIWDVGVTAISAIGSAMTSPNVVGVIVAFEVLGLAALYCLDRMLSSERRGDEMDDADSGPDQRKEQK